MSKDKIKKSDFDNIFSSELYFLSHADDVAEKSDKLTREDLLEEYNALKKNYGDLLKQTKKIIKIGDSTQRKLRDVQTKLQEQNERINAQNEKLKNLNATKDKFFSIISHDLRNPITSILMMAEILKYSSDKLSKQELESKIDVIIKSIKNLYDLFENLLKWSNAQTGRLKFQPEEIKLNELVEKAFSLLSANAESKNIVLESDLPDKSTIFADKNMVDSILRNLLSNAIKFTHSGGIVCVSAIIENDGALISVEDNGAGIESKVIPKLFRIDEHYKSKGTLNETGSGLGLILCKEFVEKHRGKIWVETEIGKGSTFKFTIPLIR